MSDQPHPPPSPFWPLRRIPLADDGESFIQLQEKQTFVALLIDDRHEREKWEDGGPSFYLPTHVGLGLAQMEELHRQLGAAIKTLRAQRWREQGAEGVKQRARELRDGRAGTA